MKSLKLLLESWENNFHIFLYCSKFSRLKLILLGFSDLLKSISTFKPTLPVCMDLVSSLDSQKMESKSNMEFLAMFNKGTFNIFFLKFVLSLIPFFSNTSLILFM